MHSQTGLLERCKQLVGRVDAALRLVLIGTMFLMAVIVIVQVIARYFFSYSFDAADELSKLFFVWSIFLAIPFGVKYGLHVGIDLVVIKLPSSVQNILFRTLCVFSLMLCVIVAHVTMLVIIDKWGEMMPTIDFTSSILYIPVFIAMVQSVFHLAILAVGGAKTWQTEDAQ
ncbi:TRAP transporter small permease subunit [Desulfovibrio sp. OttesenSCG-928-O18]|nr:TRAP transporter small permease subunit [Desulfovibrio sp. OttesenSCG-928-O18]